MVDYVVEKISLWDYLAQQKRPVVIYGMGEGALKIMRVCKQYGVEIAGIFASDEYVRGHSFEGFLVEKLSDVERRLADFIVLVAFGVDYDEMIEHILDIARRHETYSPDVPVFGEELFTLRYYLGHREQFDRAYNLMADERSKSIFADMINYKISGKLEYLKRNMGCRADDFDELLRLGDDEVYLDLGAYDGDTVLEFVEHSQGYEKIYALEPDPKNFRKLAATVERNGIERIECIQKGSYSHDAELPFLARAGRNSALGQESGNILQFTSVDRVLNDSRATYIKMDVEGAEEQTLAGCSRTIALHAPKLSVAAYHRSSDLYLLPLLIADLNPNYRLYLRRHKYIPAWEIILYAL